MIARLTQAFATCGIVAVLAGPVHAAPTEDAVTFAKVIAANGCLLTDANSDKVRTELNLSDERGMAAAQSLMTEGLVTPGEDGIALDAKYCAELGGTPAAAAEGTAEVTEVSEAEQRFVATLKEAGCRLKAADNEAFLAKAGLDAAQAGEVLMGLSTKGLIEMEGDTLTLKVEDCN